MNDTIVFNGKTVPVEELKKRAMATGEETILRLLECHAFDSNDLRLNNFIFEIRQLFNKRPYQESPEMSIDNETLYRLYNKLRTAERERLLYESIIELNEYEPIVKKRDWISFYLVIVYDLKRTLSGTDFKILADRITPDGCCKIGSIMSNSSKYILHNTHYMKWTNQDKRQRELCLKFLEILKKKILLVKAA